MAQSKAAGQATFTHMYFCAGATSLFLAIAIHRLCKKRRLKHQPSLRSRALTRGGLRPHILEHIARMSDPDYVCLSIAENKLTVKPLLDKLLELTILPRQLSREGSLAPTDQICEFRERTVSSGRSTWTSSIATVTPSTILELADGDDRNQARGVPVTRMTGTSSVPPSLGYGDPTGPLWVRFEMAKMMTERMFHRNVDPDNLCIGAGTDAILRTLMMVLTEEGQGCLIPQPFYAGFDEVLTSAGLIVWGVNIPGSSVDVSVDAVISPDVLQEALRDALSACVDVRLLLITSPQNPTGQLYSAKALITAIEWARKRNLQVIVDEIYANCVHNPSALFRSAGSLVADLCAMGNDVHVVYGLSKDFGVAGWRIGVLYTENRAVMTKVASMVRLSSQASSYTLDMVGRLFKEQGFLNEFFEKHEKGLRSAYVSLTDELDRAGIKHMQADAGLFAMLDLREYIEESSKEAEAKLWRQILDGIGVNLTPGYAFRCSEPGWFRLCFAYQDIDVVSRSVGRLGVLLQTLVCTSKHFNEQEKARIGFGGDASGPNATAAPRSHTVNLEDS